MTQTAPPADRPHAAAKRYIYAWGGGHAEGDATMRDLLGGKGAGVRDMRKLGFLVPEGFTITTEACTHYIGSGELPEGLMDDVKSHMALVEEATDRGFGRPPRTRCSSRSGAGPLSPCPG